MFGNPWMAYVLSSNKACGGSLITNRFVLTAAHCLTYQFMEVFLGDFDISSRTDCSARGCMPNALRVPVDQQIPHSRYVHFTRDDIALLRLAGSVRYTDFIRPICLLTNSNPLSTLRHLTVTVRELGDKDDDDDDDEGQRRTKPHQMPAGHCKFSSASG
ncbi:serine protease easter-like [Drosophila serrata]|uniref:serine protease easter-like n=1 Tax=Drosophila serrata TaxID=7274 RepID=UPI000A1D256B|nr:serine protease easter-like [Drosophila serrata]